MRRKSQPVSPDPIIGNRKFVDRAIWAIFQDPTGQYLMTDDWDRVYAVYLTPEVSSPWPAILNGPTPATESER